MSAPTLPASHTQVRLARRPNSTGNLDTAQVFEVVSSPTPRVEDVKEGELLVHTLYLSMDPSMRVWVNEEESYLPPVELGGVMRGSSICEVVASRHPGYKSGDRITAFEETWQDYAIVTPGPKTKILKSYPGIQFSDYLGVLGATGLTAYFGILDIGKVKEGDVIAVSGAAGATGSVAGQIAKIIGASLVVGIAGSADKCKWLAEECGYDVVLNYRDPDFNQKLKDTVPRGVDVYFDNVGGEITDAVYQCMNMHGRVIACGAISQYNNPNPVGLSWLTYQSILLKRLRIEGFIVLDYVSRWAEAVKVMSGWLAQGKIKRTETIVTGGVKEAPKALSMLFSGGNTGKLIMQTEKSRL